MKMGRHFIRKSFASIFILILIITTNACEKSKYYLIDDFKKIPKTDVHLHVNTLNKKYMGFISQYNFRVVSPNVDAGISIDEQLQTASALKKSWPGKFVFLGTFTVDDFGEQGFTDNVIKRIDHCKNAGASGIKIWKNVGMTLKDSFDEYVMIDDPRLDSIFIFMVENKIPVMGHMGEPRNCWLPLHEMNDSSNYRYYKSHPEYHMYLHPEAPSYKDQIDARDNLLNKFPDLIFTAAHLGSLEWDVDEIAKRLDRFPNMNIDLSARIAHLQYQSIIDYDKVRNFMIKYQDRIMYGTDITINENQTDPDAILQRLLDRWQSNWSYLATDVTQEINDITQPVKGLKLPKEVIDKIYNTNADYFF
ncbi:amidohydrolase family protein [Petrimonas sp.]|jgi:predicted TIM-barrel fold metal-dependent hydrolase|uniref:amidohydrolase family protein n=1 Tax=Petrimonas sp. TaxID=2023866 RepID=UPI000E863ADC|nr:amidohydrolase [Clostridiales bacterium]